MSRHKIEVELVGSISEYRFYLEGEPIRLKKKQDKYEEVLKDFEVEGKLFISLICRSKYRDDQECSLSIKVDGKTPGRYPRTIEFEKKLAVEFYNLELPVQT
jgi:hypothetical protein